MMRLSMIKGDIQFQSAILFNSFFLMDLHVSTFVLLFLFIGSCFSLDSFVNIQSEFSTVNL